MKSPVLPRSLPTPGLPEAAVVPLRPGAPHPLLRHSAHRACGRLPGPEGPVRPKRPAQRAAEPAGEMRPKEESQPPLWSQPGSVLNALGPQGSPNLNHCYSHFTDGRTDEQS